jgi:hypothetical protein
LTIKKTTLGVAAEVIDTPAGRIFAPAPDHTPSPLLSEYLTEAELAAELGRTVRTIARWRAIGEGPRFLKIGRETRYRRESVRAWMVGLEQDA